MTQIKIPEQFIPDRGSHILYRYCHKRRASIATALPEMRAFVESASADIAESLSEMQKSAV